MSEFRLRLLKWLRRYLSGAVGSLMTFCITVSQTATVNSLIEKPSNTSPKPGIEPDTSCLPVTLTTTRHTKQAISIIQKIIRKKVTDFAKTEAIYPWKDYNPLCMHMIYACYVIRLVFWLCSWKTFNNWYQYATLFLGLMADCLTPERVYIYLRTFQVWISKCNLGKQDLGL